MTITEDIIKRLKGYGYAYTVDWVDLQSIPDTMRDGSIFVEIVNLGSYDGEFKLRNTNQVKPWLRTIRFSLINQRNKQTIDRYCEKMRTVILDCITLDKSAHPTISTIELDGGQLLQDEKFYVYQFNLKVMNV